MIKRCSALAEVLLLSLLACRQVEAQPAKVVSVAEKEVRLTVWR